MAKSTKILMTAAFTTLLVSHDAVAAAQFSGGLCQSQGSWLQSALTQSSLISDAINALRNDPACKALVDALERSPKVDPNSVAGAGQSDMTSYANLTRELSALADYMKPSRVNPNAGVEAGPGALTDQRFQQLVYQVVFNKSYDSIKNLAAEPEFVNMSAGQTSAVADVSQRVRAFMKKSEDVANLTMATAKNIVAALPESKLCLHNRPSESAAIFSSVVHASASLLTGGRVNGVGEFLGALITYNREMDYINQLLPLERERFNSSVSCLVESTSEAYCAMEDGEDALDFLKASSGNTGKKELLNQIIKNNEADPVANPLAGLVILMRDVPTIQGWMQKVLFGIEPRISVEATMKNSYWQSFVGFLTSVNKLKADFRDKEQLYLNDAAKKDKIGKLSLIQEIHGQIFSNMVGGSSMLGGGGDMNFYTRIMNNDLIKFYLVGVDQLPAGFNPMMRTFDAFWAEWVTSGANGFNDPDKLLQTMRGRLWELMDRAQTEANSFFGARMIVDPQNLVTEAMKGPGISPYQAFYNMRSYYANLSKKLARSAKTLSQNPETRIQARQLQAQLPMLNDSIRRIDAIITQLNTIADLPADANDQQMLDANRNVMNFIYDTANMMVSRDSFFGTRMQTAVQADISDTLLTNRNLTEHQSQLLFAIGGDVVLKLSNYFGNDPVLQRADLAQAKVVQIKNLESVEGTFARVMWQQIMDLSCQIDGGVVCDYKKQELDPAAKDSLLSANSARIKNINEAIQKGRDGRGLVYKWRQWMNPATEDSDAHRQLLAKLCIQTLAFKSRDAFATVCQGAKLISEFSGSDDKTSVLDMSYDEQLAAIKNAKTTGAGGIDKARGQGVCALRTYIRKNHVFRMYRDYSNIE